MSTVTGDLNTDFNTLEKHLSDHHGKIDDGDRQEAAAFEQEAEKAGYTGTATLIQESIADGKFSKSDKADVFKAATADAYNKLLANQ